MYKRCPKCKGKVEFRRLTGKYYCWECEKYYYLKDLFIAYNDKDLLR